MTDRILGKHEVEDISGLSPVTQWREEKEGRFPKRRQISPGRVGWLESEILEWMASRPVSQLPSPKPKAGVAA
jgi:prophage regulatory protein